YHYTASGRLAAEFKLGRLFLRPGVSADWLRLDEESYVETDGGLGYDLEVFDRTSEIFAGTGGITIGGMFGARERTWWSPRLRAGYRHEFSVEYTPVLARFVGSDEIFTLYPEDLPESGQVYGFTFAAGSRFSSFSFDYDVDTREGYLQHIARVGFRFLF
ncbi:MAG: autotransporter outer membrane beta-barrel domain-containing protein, partial [Caulobacterales bacterium]|nr:autotransporter outer membrane beta-barrel domain-containing protein [Caulobacterales bacterium]